MFGYKSLKIRNLYPDFTNAGFVHGNNTTSPEHYSSLIGTFTSVERIKDIYFDKPRDIIQISFTLQDGESINILTNTRNVFTMKLLGAMHSIVGKNKIIELSMISDDKRYISPVLRDIATGDIIKSKVFMQLKSEMFEQNMFYLLDNINHYLNLDLSLDNRTAG